MKLISFVVAALCLFVESALASRAEFGQQDRISGFKSNSDYSGLGATKYVAVWATAANKANLATATTSSSILGILQNGPKVGEGMEIARSGLSKMVAGGAITVNAIVTCNGSGRAAAVTSGDFALGMALEAAGADGDVITVNLFPPMRWTGAA